MAEHLPSKQDVVGSSPIARSEVLAGSKTGLVDLGLVFSMNLGFAAVAQW